MLAIENIELQQCLRHNLMEQFDDYHNSLHDQDIPERMDLGMLTSLHSPRKEYHTWNQIDNAKVQSSPFV